MEIINLSAHRACAEADRFTATGAAPANTVRRPGIVFSDFAFGADGNLVGGHVAGHFPEERPEVEVNSWDGICSAELTLCTKQIPARSSSAFTLKCTIARAAAAQPMPVC